MKVLDDYNEKLNRLDIATNKWEAYLNENKETLGRWIMNTVLIIIILFAFGCFDFMTLKFDLSRITTSVFWTKISSKMVAGVCAFNVGININWSQTIKNCIELKDAIALNTELNKKKDNTTFEYYVDTIWNKQEKIKAYVYSINRRLYWLNRFAKDTDKLLWLRGTEEEKAKNRYCRKRATLEALKTKEYIENNIDGLKVHYKRVNATAFDMDVETQTVRYEQTQTQGNITLGKVSESKNVAITMFLIAAFTTAIILDLNQQQFEDQMRAFFYYLLNALVDAGIVIWKLIQGTRASKRIINKQLIKPYNGRNKVLIAYYNWKKENNIPESASYELLQQVKNPVMANNDDNTEYIEMSQEEFDKLNKNK